MKFIWISNEYGADKIQKAKSKVKFDWRKFTIGSDEIKYDFCHKFHENRNDWNSDNEKTLVN